MTTLTRAHIEWATRAQDERFASIEAMHAAAVDYRVNARTAKGIDVSKLRAVAVGDDVQVIGSTGAQAKLTNWAFAQLCGKAEAPAGYLQSLPSTLAADCLNNGLASYSGNPSSMLFKADVGQAMTVRAITSERYSRIWNCDVTARLLDLEASGDWQPAPAAFDGSRGLYLSDRDMFAFLVDNDRRIFETLPGGGLSRGFFMWNSETGSASIGLSTFLYEYVCGNHRVWGAQNVKEIAFRHVGSNLDDRAYSAMAVALTEYANSSAADDEAKILRMRETEIAASKDEILDALVNKIKMTRKLADQAYDLAEQREDWYGNPRTVWAIAGAVTEIGRDMPTADKRMELDRIGAKIMETQF